MEAVREKWTDERLDDLKETVGDGFDRMDRRFEAIDRRFEAIDQRFAHVEARIDALQRSMLQGFVALVGVQVTLFAALAALIVALH